MGKKKKSVILRERRKLELEARAEVMCTYLSESYQSLLSLRKMMRKSFKIKWETELRNVIQDTALSEYNEYQKTKNLQMLKSAHRAELEGSLLFGEIPA